MLNKTIKYFLAVASIAASTTVNATSIQIISTDGPGEGFNSAAAVEPVTGNDARTLGEQYTNVFRAAADFFEGKIISDIDILIEAAFDPLRCEANTAQLGGAGPLNAFINFQNAPRRNTAYVSAQANSLAGVDLDPGTNDIGAVFNSSLNGDEGCLGGVTWWLGINSPAPARTVSLYDTVLHEIGHGLGFLTFVDSDGVRIQSTQGTPFNDPYMLNLFDVVQDLPWSQMTDEQRAKSSLNNGSLVWSGQAVAQGAGVFTGGRNGSGQLRIYAPREFDEGSSVSHWDVAVGPNELMEPFATPTSNGCATILALRDMGWRTQNECPGGATSPEGSNPRPSNTNDPAGSGG